MKKKYLYSILALASAGVFIFTYFNSNKELSQGETIAQEDKQYVAAPSVAEDQIYVTPYWVHSVLSGNQDESFDFAIFECSQDELEKADSYLDNHIEGAYHLDLNLLEDSETGLVRSPEEIAEVFASYGITKYTTIIFYSSLKDELYDDRAATIALWAGVTNVKCLDGGIDSYITAGFPVETFINIPEPTETYFGLEIPGRPDVFSSQELVLSRLENDYYKIVSVRSYEEFNGSISGNKKIKTKGEIDGAVWGREVCSEYYQNLDDTTIELTELNRMLIPYDVSTDDNHLTFYCIDGYKASVPYLIAYQAGATDISIYDGGWKEWTSASDNPIQIGEPLSIDLIHTTVSGN